MCAVKVRQDYHLQFIGFRKTWIPLYIMVILDVKHIVKSLLSIIYISFYLTSFTGCVQLKYAEIRNNSNIHGSRIRSEI